MQRREFLQTMAVAPLALSALTSNEPEQPKPAIPDMMEYTRVYHSRDFLVRNERLYPSKPICRSTLQPGEQLLRFLSDPLDDARMQLQHVRVYPPRPKRGYEIALNEPLNLHTGVVWNGRGEVAEKPELRCKGYVLDLETMETVFWTQQKPQHNYAYFIVEGGKLSEVHWWRTANKTGRELFRGCPAYFHYAIQVDDSEQLWSVDKDHASLALKSWNGMLNHVMPFSLNALVT